MPSKIASRKSKNIILSKPLKNADMLAEVADNSTPLKGIYSEDRLILSSSVT
jgi:hypothetical protein